VPEAPVANFPLTESPESQKTYRLESRWRTATLSLAGIWPEG